MIIPTTVRRRLRSALSWLSILLLPALAGCATRQVTVQSVSQTAAYRQAMASALTTDRPASGALVVLRRHGLEEMYRQSPDQCLATLWPKVLADGRRDGLHALAELCFGRARQLDRPAWRFGHRQQARDTYLAAAASAYLYLFSPGNDPLPTAYDRRLRIACDLYNTALGRAFADADGKVTLAPGSRETPLGRIDIAFDQPELMASILALDAVLLADRYAVEGLEIRNRTSGIGTPVIAVKRRDSQRPFRQAFGATLVLTFEPPADPAAGMLKGSLRTIPATDRPEILIGDARVPVEMDQTVPIAYALSDPWVWKLGRQVFRLGQAPVHTGIYPTEPYTPGKIPILLVHGTMSSPFLWADMWNSLRADPEIRQHYQFWLYFYESSRPLGVSANNLRTAIADTVAAMDPQSQDAALRQMVVVGHSQGGLLTKMTAIDTGEILLEAITGKPLADLKLSEKDAALARKYGIFTPLPQVRRVVFISTPHRGSYQASGLVRSLVRRLVRVPADLTQMSTLLDTVKQQLTLPAEFRRLPTSVDSMSPKNPVMLRLAEIPLAPGVHGHSIIPIKGDAKPPAGKDGVVSYASAHQEYVESEFVVRDGHSCQGNPLVIEEVRRILLEHLESE